ncbi:acyltransferase family protein [Promicromonospora panici]|uniref:acyltransferase family protein n=1 Tax=Promicromonospora panici TaxID=2219658 RepID=UPI0013EE3CA1|nr:acyltransferase family protein [Promicromonospora panici]
MSAEPFVSAQARTGAAQPTVTTPAEPATASAAPAKPRAEWADVAKGVCILLVVLWHVIMKMYLTIDWHLPVPLPGLWGAFGDMLLPLRMPVFFTISGMFAFAAVQRSWSTVARSRIARFYYLYLVWFTVHTLVLSMVPDFDTLAARSALDVLEQLTITPTNLWYLVALALYFVVAKLTRRLPTWAVLVPALALSVIASADLLAAPGNRGQLYQNLFFFLVGLRFRPLIERWAKAATLPRFLVGGALYLGLMVGVQVLNAQDVYGVWPAVCIVAVVVGIAGAVQLERWRAGAALLARLGRQTLPIYVIHMPLLALLTAVLVGPFSQLGTGPQLVVAVLLPIVLVTLLVSVCLTLHTWLLNAGATWLFDLPTFSRAARRGSPATTAGSPAQPGPAPGADGTY